MLSRGPSFSFTLSERNVSIRIDTKIATAALFYRCAEAYLLQRPSDLDSENLLSSDFKSISRHGIISNGFHIFSTPSMNMCPPFICVYFCRLCLRRTYKSDNQGLINVQKQCPQAENSVSFVRFLSAIFEIVFIANHSVCIALTGCIFRATVTG